MKIETIEKSLSKAKRIVFFPSESPNEPSLMGLVFDYDPIFEAINAYKSLQEKFKNLDLTILIREKSPGIAISIISNLTSEVFNLDPIIESGMNDFMAQLAANTPFAMVIFQDEKHGLIMLQTNTPFSPIVLGGYSTE